MAKISKIVEGLYRFLYSTVCSIDFYSIVGLHRRISIVQFGFLWCSLFCRRPRQNGAEHTRVTGAQSMAVLLSYTV